MIKLAATFKLIGSIINILVILVSIVFIITTIAMPMWLFVVSMVLLVISNSMSFYGMGILSVFKLDK